MSPIFINKEHKAEYELRNPWLDGGAPGANTGVIGEITPNLPRAAHDSGNEEVFFEHVEEQIDVAVEGLEAKRAFLEEELKVGHLPVTASVVDSFDDFFGAIGVVGVQEALLNLMGKGIDSMKGKAVSYKIIEAMRDRIEAHEKDTGHRFCLEAEPSGEAGHQLAILDKEKFPEMQASGVEAPFYTRSTCLPVDYSDDLWDALEHQKKLQGMYTGGSIFNVFLERGIADPSECKILVKRIFERAQIPCFAISPRLNIPTASGQEQYDRIGYSYRAVSSFGAGEKEEVGLRRPYDVLSEW
jgi:ribonucleoside-triphosphate reductase